ncbi:MAG: hypothetical protein K6F30_10220 [Lachnospiraceae bacterium]|nr:hypothetical protein [Lachnospiraceae bacterium]
MINICLALHDEKGTYAKYTAVTMLSVFLSTKESVRVFLLHDNTLSEENKHRFDSLVNEYNQRIEFVLIDAVDEWNSLKNISAFTVGTMFRLLIPTVLPDEVEKVIYLDSDIVVNMDVSELWNMDFADKLILGRKEIRYDNPIFNLGVDENTYINAGVLLMDLKAIRSKYDFLAETTSYLRAHPDCMWNDEDAINYVLDGQQRVISNRFNSYTAKLRENFEEKHDSCIYHFAGDFPHPIDMKDYDALFFDVLKKTPFGDGIINSVFFRDAEYIAKQKKKIALELTNRLKKASNIAFWGAKETAAYKELKERVRFAKKNVRFLDSKDELNGTKLDGYVVCHPNEIVGENDVFVVVLAYNHYEVISKSLTDMGFTEHKNYACVNEFFYSESWMRGYLDRVV